MGEASVARFVPASDEEFGPPETVYESARALTDPFGEANEGAVPESRADRPDGRGEEAQGAAETAE